MRMIHLSLIIAAVAVAAGGPTAAVAAPCDRLTPAKRKAADSIFRSVYPYDCCDETLDRCLKQFKVCKLAKRLRDDICRRLKAGQNAKRIKGALDRRARSMIGRAGKKASFQLAGAPAVGPSGAPVTVVVYACTRCPFCSKVVPELHRLATQSGLKGKLRLYFRPFPIRGHPGAVEGALAFEAAASLGKFWSFMRKLYGRYDQYTVDKLLPWAKQLGISVATFQLTMKAKQTRKAVIAAKKEGLRNGVKATPTIYINGRQYIGDMDNASLLDVLDEEADRRGGRQHCGK